MDDSQRGGEVNTKNCSLHWKYFPNESRVVPVDQFSKMSKSKDGLQAHCRRCDQKHHEESDLKSTPKRALLDSIAREPKYGLVFKGGVHASSKSVSAATWKLILVEYARRYSVSEEAKKIEEEPRKKAQVSKPRGSFVRGALAQTILAVGASAIAAAVNSILSRAPGEKRKRVASALPLKPKVYASVSTCVDQFPIVVKHGSTEKGDGKRPEACKTSNPWAVGVIEDELVNWGNSREQDSFEKAHRGQIQNALRKEKVLFDFHSEGFKFSDQRGLDVFRRVFHSTKPTVDEAYVLYREGKNGN